MIATVTPQAIRATNIGDLQLLVESFYDAQKLRIQMSNRVSAIERAGGVALPPLVAGVESLKRIEHTYVLATQREWRKHPLAPWGKNVRGVGELTMAKIVSLLGGDVARKPDGSLRTLRQLWQYCGVGDPTRKRRRGMSQEEALALGNPALRKELYVLATNMLKTGNRSVYDFYRDEYTKRDDWSDGRRHNAALRMVAKEFLRSLWIESNGATKANGGSDSIQGDVESTILTSRQSPSGSTLEEQ